MEGIIFLFERIAETFRMLWVGLSLQVAVNRRRVSKITMPITGKLFRGFPSPPPMAWF